MNKKIVFNITGKILQALSGILMLPMIVALIYKENCILAFFTVSLVSLVLGSLLRFVTRRHGDELYAKEGFAIVSLAWLSASLIGCLPFMISGEIPNFFDAFFETVSGFTTTGASVVPEVEALSHAVLFWRSFTHWIGGMGVLVFILAFVSSLSDRAIHIMRAEMPGPAVGKIVPRAKDTSKVLYIMYIVMTLVQIVFLAAGEMDLFESIVHSLGTAGTGGFGIKGDGLASYDAYSQWIITIFMLIFGVNFNLYYLMTIRRFRAVLKSDELWAYLGIVGVSTAAICFDLVKNIPSLSSPLRHAAFQVSSIITTTGYATADFNTWPSLSKAIILMLIFIGGCAGSTAGGLKISRVVIMFKMGLREIKRLIHPRSVGSVRFEEKNVDAVTQSSITTYFAVYIMCFLATFLIISFEPFNFETNFTAAATCFNNVGPGFGDIGPFDGFSGFSPFSKLVLSFAMLFGRLEIFPLLIALIPSTWRK